MAKKKNQVPGQKKPDMLTMLLLGGAALLIIVACWICGAAMDYAVGADGKVDTDLLSSGFAKVTSDMDLLLASLKHKNGYAPKMLFLGACCVGIYALYKYSQEKKRLHRRGVEHGSAKWGDEKEMKSLADQKKKPRLQPILNSDGKRVFDKKGDFVGVIVDNNILLTKEVYLSLNAKQHLLNLNVLIIGGSGSGKTRFFAKPNIMQLNTSYVITDPKGEILQSTGKMLKEAGYEVRVLNLIQMEHSNNYNPFHYVYDHNGNLSQDNIKKMINVLFKSTKGDGEKEDFWSQKGQSLLEAITFLLFEESEYNAEFDENGNIIPETRDLSHLNFFSVTEKMRRLQYPPSGGKKPDGFFLQRESDESEEAFEQRRSKTFLCPLDRDFLELERRKGDTLAGRLYKEVRNAPEETGQSFLSSANVKTFMFNMDNMMNLTCCDNIELEKLGDRKTALFLIIPATDSTYNFVVAMLYAQMFDVLANRANFRYGGTLPVHVRCIMDEFANIGQIPDFDKVIAFVRSMGMSLNVIVQNIAQLKAKYEKTWEVITGNCDSLLFLGGKEESTLKYISESLGKETIDITGHNRTKGGKQSSTSENNSIIGRELMQQNELSTMPISDCVLMIRSHNPFYCTKYPIEDHPNYQFLEDYDKANAFDVQTIHAVSLKEFEKQRNQTEKEAEKVDTNSNPQADTEEKIQTIFRHDAADAVVTAVEIEPETYEDAALYAEVEIADVPEEYTDASPKYGEVSAWDSFDLGEPTKPREELKEDEETDVPFAVESDIIQYAEPEEDVQPIGDLSDETVQEAVMEMTEYFADAIADELLQEAEDYGMDMDLL